MTLKAKYGRKALTKARCIDMEDPVEWQKNLAICNKTCNEIMDKFFDKLLESKVELPRSSEIFTTRSVISRANKGKSNDQRRVRRRSV